MLSKYNSKILTIIKSVLVILLFLFSGAFQRLGLIIFDLDINNLSKMDALILTSFSEIMVFLILIIVYFKDLRKDFKNLKKDFNKNMDIAIKWWFIGIGIMIISNIIIGLLFKNATAGNEENVQALIKANSTLAIFIFGIIGPVVEELVFRKSFRDMIKNDTLFVLVSGLIFGGLHVLLSLTSAWDLLYLIPYCSLGLAFSNIYKKTNNIYYSMFIHIFHNTFFSILSVYGIGVILW